MARQRRGGFRTPEIRGTLGTLLRTTAGTLRDVFERGAREGRSRLDDVRSNKRRNDALAQLGEIVLELIRNDEIDLAELPEVRAIVEQLDDLDADHGPPPPADEELPRAPVRRRFDDRVSKETRDLKIPTPRDDDGTVSSASYRAPRRNQPERVWRPVAEPAAPDPRARNRDDASTRSTTRSIAPRKGGISFDDDSNDLADYMHPDDVPAKPDPDDKH